MGQRTIPESLPQKNLLNQLNRGNLPIDQGLPKERKTPAMTRRSGTKMAGPTHEDRSSKEKIGRAKR